MTDTKKASAKTKGERRCTACRQMREKRELIRIVRTPQGEVRFDESGRMNGRGAYLCRSADCLRKAEKTKCLDRSLGVKVPPGVYEKLEEEVPI